MHETSSEWALVAVCSSCRQPLSLTSTAVLLRATLLGPRGVVLDALGERWPEPGRLFHPRCFVHSSGRAALYASFVRGRFDKGVARATQPPGFDPGDNASTDDATWALTVTWERVGPLVKKIRGTIAPGPFAISVVTLP